MANIIGGYNKKRRDSVHRSYEKSKIENIVGIPSAQVVPYTIPALIRHFDFFNRFQTLGTASLTELSRSFGFDPRVFDAILDYLRKEGFVDRRKKWGDFVYSLSQLAEQFLVEKGEYDLSAFATILEGNVPPKLGESIAYALRTGNPAKWDEKDTWADAMARGNMTKAFSDGVMARGKYLCAELQKNLSDVFNRPQRLLDIGGSLGDYSGGFTERFKDLECTVLDLPAVIQRADSNISEKGYQRISTIAMDMFKEGLPAGYDAHFYSNVLHDWTSDQIVQLLGKSYETLDDNGIVIVHDMHLDNDRKGPDHVVNHSLYLSIFSKGRCYSYKEMAGMMKKSGLERVEIRKTVAGYSAMIGYKQVR